jgi:hypothetical protein
MEEDCISAIEGDNKKDRATEMLEAQSLGTVGVCERVFSSLPKLQQGNWNPVGGISPLSERQRHRD